MRLVVCKIKFLIDKFIFSSLWTRCTKPVEASIFLLWLTILAMWVLPKQEGTLTWPLWKIHKQNDYFTIVKSQATFLAVFPYRLLLNRFVFAVVKFKLNFNSES